MKIENLFSKKIIFIKSNISCKSYCHGLRVTLKIYI